MAFIIRLAKRFPGRCRYDYDRAFRLEAADWSAIKLHPLLTETTLVASREVIIKRLLHAALGTMARVAALASRETYRFRHRCDRDGWRCTR